MSYLHYGDTPISILLFSCSQIVLLILNVYLKLLFKRMSHTIFLIISLISLRPVTRICSAELTTILCLNIYLRITLAQCLLFFSTLLMNPDSEVHAAEYMDSSDWFKEPKVNQLEDSDSATFLGFQRESGVFLSVIMYILTYTCEFSNWSQHHYS